jgi:Ca2+-binding RTX toxin-like protein
MAIFRITRATSVFTDALFDDAFRQDSPGADTLIVDPGAFLVAQFGTGASLANTGAWTVTVNGSIVSPHSIGIVLGTGNTAVSTIKIGVDGEVQGLAGINLGSSANINNAGTISGLNGIAIDLFAGETHTITNSGNIIGNISGSVGTDTVRNSGTINGDIALFGGNDVVTDFAIVGDVMKSGTITGTVLLGDGNDKFSGGANPETVQDGNGADIVSLGGGNDTYVATGNTGTDNVDIVKGGAGIDTYDASKSSVGLTINLDIVAHELSPGMGFQAANTATGLDISGAAKDTITGFENVKGGSGPDIIYGSAAANVLDGGAGTDHLFGGAGKDQLTGGLDPDTFHYAKLSDSGITAATRDLIADFDPSSDLIDLHLIDANKATAADDAFNFVGTNIPTGFSGNPGELHAFFSAIGQIIEGDVNGDAKADFSIELQDPTHAITLTSASFSL